MDKLDPKYENPIDLVLIKLSHIVKPFFHNLNFTANHITTLSVIFGIAAIYLLYIDKVLLSVFALFICYFFDCLDGVYARTYDDVTKFGDYYDHISDAATYILYIAMIIYKCQNKAQLIPFLIVLFIFIILMHVQLGCQEKIYNSPDSPTLARFKKMCPDPPKKTIKFSRYFGCGSTILAIGLVAIISKTVCKNTT